LALAKAEFTLGIRPVSTLLPHEEVIPSRVKQLVEDMRRDRVQKDPVIIDRESSTVLDGMHRLAAFAELEVGNAVCCSVEYSSRAVTLGRWARAYTGGERASIGQLPVEVGRTKRKTLAEAFEALDRREAAFALLSYESAHLSEEGSGLEGAARAMKALDREAEGGRWERSFFPEDEIDVPLQNPRTFVLLVRRVTKDEVVTAARTGNLFPCKTSMHVIDPRPVAVNFPVVDLNGATTATLRERLKGRAERLVPADSVYEGRRYKERLLFLDQQ
jgi:L-serine kinase (ADP)